MTPGDSSFPDACLYHKCPFSVLLPYVNAVPSNPSGVPRTRPQGAGWSANGVVGKPLTYTLEGLVDFQLEIPCPIYSVGIAMTHSYIEILGNSESEKTYLL